MKINLCFIFLFFINQQVFPQSYDIDTSNNIPSIHNDITSVYNTGVRLLSAPSDFNKNDWITLGSVTALTSAAFLIDKENRDFWQRNRTKTLDDISEVGRVYGEISYAAILSASLYLGGKIFKDKEVTVTGRMLLEGLLYAGLTTTVIKFVTGRSRPYLNEGETKFRFFQTKNDYTSFPSGHITVAFTLSSILSERINNTFATIAMYVLASSTFWQRMYSDKHWLSDAILGSSIGFFIGKAVVKFDDETNSKNFNSIIFMPSYSGGVLSFNLIYSF